MYFCSSWIQTLFPLCSVLTKPFWKTNAGMQTGQDARPFMLPVRRRLSPEAHFLSGVYSAVVTQPQTSIPAASAQFKVYTTVGCVPCAVKLSQSSFMDQFQLYY